MVLPQLAPEDISTIEDASERYLRGDLSIEAYEELLNGYYPSTETLLKSLDQNRGFVATLAKWLKQYRPPVATR